MPVGKQRDPVAFIPGNPVVGKPVSDLLSVPRGIDHDIVSRLSCPKHGLLSDYTIIEVFRIGIIRSENGLVTADEAASRISNVASRPLFGDLEQARRVIQGRLPLYEEVADASIDTAGRTSSTIAGEALRLLKREGVLVERQV